MTMTDRVRDPVAEIQEIVDRETRAWDTRDVDLLLSVLHPDMVWPFPPGPDAHDPMQWVMVLGRFDRTRWRQDWQALFDTHTLVRNERVTRRIQLSAQNDGAFAVVDVDTLWQSHAGVDQHWCGRAGKIYTRVGSEWKMIAQTGLLHYGLPPD